jgi:hypothetical protein
VLRGLQQVQQGRRIVREIGVHLADGFRPSLQSLEKALYVSAAQAQLAGPVAHEHPPGVLHSQLLRQRAGAVRAVIVHHQHPQVVQW